MREATVRSARTGLAIVSLTAVVAACSGQHGNGVVTGPLPHCGPDLPSYAKVHDTVRVSQGGRVIRSATFGLGRNGLGRYRFVLPAGTYALTTNNLPPVTVKVSPNRTTVAILQKFACF